jgi:hypothetical protein
MREFNAQQAKAFYASRYFLKCFVEVYVGLFKGLALGRFRPIFWTLMGIDFA